MAKVMQVSTYDAENEVWNIPVDIGAKAENVDITMADASTSNVQVEILKNTAKLTKIGDGSKLDDAIIDTVSPTGTDTSKIITGNSDVDVDSGVTIKSFAEKYNKRGLRINNKFGDYLKIEDFSDIFVDNAGAHNSIYRGKNLGTEVTAEQYAEIKAGTFKDMYIGDYWEINGTHWRIADFDYWYGYGDTELKKHHIVIMPDEILYEAVMNATDVTTKGYVGSQMYTANLANAKTIVNTAFPNKILSHREYLVNAVTNGRPSGGAWYDSTVELPNEIMMYGSYVFTPTSDGSTVPYIYTINKSQLALFDMCPELIIARDTDGTRKNMWIRDVVSGAHFALVSSGGLPYFYVASRSDGVRPVFAIYQS